MRAPSLLFPAPSLRSPNAYEAAVQIRHRSGLWQSPLLTCGRVKEMTPGSPSPVGRVDRYSWIFFFSRTTQGGAHFLLSARWLQGRSLLSVSGKFSGEKSCPNNPKESGSESADPVVGGANERGVARRAEHGVTGSFP